MIALEDNDFYRLVDFIKKNFGINLIEKRTLVEGRLQSILYKKNYSSFAQYFNSIFADASSEEVSFLVNKLTTNHTFFYRESEHFDFYREKIIAGLTSNISSGDLRIWSAGCSSGEEPYTLAMILDEFFGPEKGLWDTKVLATDISSKVLDEAGKGVYSNMEIDTLPSQWKLNYVKKLDSEKSIFIDKIRNEVIYRKFNLMEETFPFRKKFHVIFCRNVMIYFDAETKKNLVGKFYDILEPGGYLFIGHSESLNRDETRFKYIMPAVYRKE
jgi:chemotaxis protein methyltransferase CheR